VSRSHVTRLWLIADAPDPEIAAALEQGLARSRA
jgi:hypothetical protein